MAWSRPRGYARLCKRRRHLHAVGGRADAGSGTVGAMRSPVPHLPPAIESWTSRMRWLRWLDGAATALVVWLMLALMVAGLPPIALAVTSVILVGLAAFVGPLRRRWRPISALVALSGSRDVQPGDRPWLVLAD